MIAPMFIVTLKTNHFLVMVIVFLIIFLPQAVCPTIQLNHLSNMLLLKSICGIARKEFNTRVCYVHLELSGIESFAKYAFLHVERTNK